MTRAVLRVPGSAANVVRALPQRVARIPMTIHTKLMLAFLVIALLLIALGVVGLQALGAANSRAEELGTIEKKVAAYRQLQTEVSHALYDGASAFSAPDQASLDTTLRQLRQSEYNFDRLQFVAKDEGAILEDIKRDYALFLKQMITTVEFVRAGRLDEAQALQQSGARPLTDNLERSTNELVNRAEAEMVATIDANHSQYVTSRWLVVGFSLGSIGLALLLGYAIAWSLITPIRQMGSRLREVAAGDFSRHVEIASRDELGEFAQDLNRTNDELGRLYRELETVSRHKSEFLANMSHELRTPLNAVIGFSEVLAEHYFGDLNEKQDEYVRDILSSGQHLLSLINDILDLSKVEAGRMDLDEDVFDLAETLESGIAMVRDRALRGGISLTCESATPPGFIEADERKVKQVVFNLLSNAVKFTPPGGQVTLSAARGASDVVVSVKDTGVGVAVEDQQRIFEEFLQASTRPRDSEGTGLGLALAKRFVELQGGRIWVVSEPGQGSVFSFSLPLRSTDADPANSGVLGPATAMSENLHNGAIVDAGSGPETLPHRSPRAHEEGVANS